MGNLLGNLLGLAIVVVLAIVTAVSVPGGVITFTVVAYAAWLFLTVGDLATRPSRQAPLASLLTANELHAYRTYHTYLLAPGAAQGFSALLNLLRLAGFVWAGIAFWKASPWAGGALIAYFFVVGRACLRFDPVRYFAGAANTGNDVAREQLLLLQSIESKRAAYNAAE